FVPSGILPALSYIDVSVSSDARDPSGQPLDSFFSSFQTGTALDDVAPTLIGTSPAAGATGVPVNAPIQARFSQPINAATITTASFAVRDGTGALVPCELTLSLDNSLVSFTPMRPLAPNTVHTLTIATTVTDLVGHPVVGAPIVVSFTTGNSA